MKRDIVCLGMFLVLEFLAPEIPGVGLNPAIAVLPVWLLASRAVSL